MKFRVDENYFYNGYGTDGVIDFDGVFNLNNLPSKYHKYENGSWSFDSSKAISDRIDFIREERNLALNALDGIYLGFDRDGNSSMCTDCETLRVSLKDAPDNAQAILSSMTSLEDIKAVSLLSVLTIPPSLEEYTNQYFNL